MHRRSDDELARSLYFSRSPEVFKELVRHARQVEPRINSVRHVVDFYFLAQNQTFEDKYGPEYFDEIVRDMP